MKLATHARLSKSDHPPDFSPVDTYRRQAFFACSLTTTRVRFSQVRQYFKDSSFYTKFASSTDVCATGRESSFRCSAFSPSSATVKVGTYLGVKEALKG